MTMDFAVQRMRRVLTILLGLKLFLILLFVAVVWFVIMQGTRGEGTLLDGLKLSWRFFLFRHSIVKELTSEEVSGLFNSTCNRGCHSMEVIHEAIHTSLGWAQLVERMRKENGVKLSPKEAKVVIQYLQDTYPAPRTGFPPETIKAVKRLLWRNDMGYGDVYVDIFYATKEYFLAIESLEEAEKYLVVRNLAFIIDLTVHTGRLSVFPFDEKTVLRDDKGREYRALPGWTMRIESREGHHREAVVRFSKFDEKGNPVIREDSKYIEVIIKDLGGAKERVYRWDLPIPYPAGMKE